MAVAVITILTVLAVVGYLEAIVLPRTFPASSGSSESSGPPGAAVPQGILDRWDPYKIEKLNFDLELKEITAKGSVSDIVITGASGLKLRYLSLMDIVDGRLAVNITVPTINVNGKYSVIGHLSQSGFNLPLDGKGSLLFGFNDLIADVSTSTGISDKGEILLDDFQLFWNMSNIKLEMDGLFGDHALGDIINKILHDSLAHLITKVYHDQITTLVTTFIKGEGKEFLEALHHDHGKPVAQGGRLTAGKVRAPRDVHELLQDAAGVKEEHEDWAARSGMDMTDGPDRLLSLINSDSDLFKLHLSKPQIFKHGELSLDSGDKAADFDDEYPSVPSLFDSDSDSLFTLHLGKPQIFKHGELSVDSINEQANYDVSDEHIQQDDVSDEQIQQDDVNAEYFDEPDD